MLLLPLLVGCQSWRPTARPALEVVAQERPSSVRITRTDGSVVTLERPVVVGDTILGSTDLGPVRTFPADVGTLEVRRVSAPRTIGLVLAQVTAVFTLVTVVIALQPHY